jgi:hypothetical protein
MDDQERLIKLQESRQQKTEKSAKIEDLEETLEEKEIEELKINRPTEPIFPVFIFSFAILKDILDFFSMGLLGWLFAILMGIIIGIWAWFKGNVVVRRILKKLVLPAISSFFIAIIPGINFFPESSVFVLLIHYNEKKEVKKKLNILKKIKI